MNSLKEVAKHIAPSLGLALQEPEPEPEPEALEPEPEPEPDVEPEPEPEPAVPPMAIMVGVVAPLTAAEIFDRAPARTPEVFPAQTDAMLRDLMQRGDGALVSQALALADSHTAAEARTIAFLRELVGFRHQVDALGARAQALVVSDAATYQEAIDLYNAMKTAEEQVEISPLGERIKAAHQLHKGLTGLRAWLLDPVALHKKPLSERAAAWQREEKKREEDARRELERQAREQEQARLRAEAQAAEAAGDTNTAAQIREEAVHVPTPAVHVPSAVPAVKGASTRSKLEVEVVDVAQAIAGINCGVIPVAAIEWNKTYLNRQANDLGAVEFAKRFPGMTTREVGGLATRRAR